MADREFSKAWMRNLWQRAKKAMFSPEVPVKHNSTPRSVRHPPGSKGRCAHYSPTHGQSPSFDAWLKRRLAKFDPSKPWLASCFMGKGKGN